MSNQRFTGTEQYVATDDLSTPRRCASHAMLVSQRMFPLTIAGLDLAVSELKHPLHGVGVGRALAAATPITQSQAPAVP